MSLNLGARHRAMLLEMGISVWAPLQVVEPIPSDDHGRSAEAFASSVAAAKSLTARTTPTLRPVDTPPPATAHRTSTAENSAFHTAVAPAITSPVGDTALSNLRLHPPQVLYPLADATATPPELGNSWLIVAESMNPSNPLEGDAGRLLDNMLRAMRLNLHPQVFFSALERSGYGNAPTTDIPRSMVDNIAATAPSMVVVLGHVAARAVLGRTEPLGRLRVVPHELARCPCVVTYDPAFLMRSQEAKAAAWSDLCHALATVRARSLAS